jgi:hypothetical protein
MVARRMPMLKRNRTESLKSSKIEVCMMWLLLRFNNYS